jgi:hypothetical protein
MPADRADINDQLIVSGGRMSKKKIKAKPASRKGGGARNRVKKKEKGPSPCMCGGGGPLLTQLWSLAGSKNETRGHFASAQLELMHVLRSALETRIQQFSGTRKGRGKNLPVR